MTNPNETYVGDRFTLSFMPGDDDSLRVFEGETGVLIGFTKRVKYVLEFQTTPQTPYPGAYSCLGDPLLRLDSGRLLKVSLCNLTPIGYSFDDCNVKNFNYLKEITKYTYIGPLPDIPYNEGDDVLVAKHGLLQDDVVGTIIDTVIKGERVFYLVDVSKEDPIEVPKEKVIDVLDLGDHSEYQRYRAQMQTVQRMLMTNHVLPSYADAENLVAADLCERDHDPEGDADSIDLYPSDS